MSRFLGVAAVICASVSPALARPVLMTHPMAFDPKLKTVYSVVNTHTLFLNRCASGCTVNVGSTDARTSTSDIPQNPSTLTAFNAGDTAWTQVVSCVKSTMAPFNITVTDVQPTSGDFFEVMVAGSPSDLGLPSNVGGIADYACGSPGNCLPYISDALVFDFANVWQGAINDICATAAQEIAHAWSLDHVVDANDPMTYNGNNNVRVYHDNEVCGSDCSTGYPNSNGMCTGPFGPQYELCSGSCNGQATHTCMSTGTASQNEITTITALFGSSNATPPTMSFATPADGAAVQPGFTVTIDCTSGDGVQEVDLSVDGTPTATFTSAPYTTQTSTALTDGSHTLSATCTTNLQAYKTITENVIVGTKCSKNTDCPTNDICYQMACIPGPNATGGLGAKCTNDGQCSSNACASDGSESVCVIPCTPGSSTCPSGFGCLMAGAGGVCWPGADSGGGGGCSTGSDGSHNAPTGLLLLVLGSIASWFTRRPARGSR